MHIKITPNITTIITGHGSVRSYLHRLKLTHTNMYLRQKCSNCRPYIIQLRDTKQRKRSVSSIVEKTNKWPTDKSQLENTIDHSVSL